MVGYLGVCLGERSRWDTHRCRCLGVLAESIERAHSSGLGAPTALPEELDTSTHRHIDTSWPRQEGGPGRGD